MRLLAISANPGDAEFGCAGTLVRVVRAGGVAAICTLTNGNAAGDGAPPRELAATRRGEAEAAAKLLGVDLFWLDHSDFTVANEAVTRAKLAEILRIFRPDAVVAPAPLGPSPDVRHAWELLTDAAAYAANPNVRTEHPPLAAVPPLLQYAAGWAPGFAPHEFVDVGAVAEAKRAALAAYPTMLAWRGGRDGIDLRDAAERVSAYRGLQAGVAHAEAFRQVWAVGGHATVRILP
ncbi:MAG: PIG-L family deacetylase [Actinobacteria bacterium]|nr:PIG-L family deacetylase [Actinomycetota bacterium]